VKQPFRIAEGGAIDRDVEIRFRFDGREYHGYGGDTLASALLAAGVRLVGRSFKYHRPRGIFSADFSEPNALVGIRSGGRYEPNTRATEVEIFDGLEARSQNRIPWLKWDVMAALELASPFLPAGFYYKTFMWPAGAWLFYERWIRRAAGLGRAPDVPDSDSYDQMNAHCDVLIVGGGPAGLTAALAAGRSGARVILLDTQNGFGGWLRSERLSIAASPAMAWVEEVLQELETMPELRILYRTTAFGYYDGNVIGAIERLNDHLPVPSEFEARQRYWKIRAGKVVLATGALERHMVFSGNDRPGVMLASAVRTYLNRFAVRPGKRAVVFANNDDGYQCALDLDAAGVDVAAVIDPRTAQTSDLADAVRAAGIACLTQAAVTATSGRHALRRVEVSKFPLDTTGPAANRMQFNCDLLAVSGGWDPALHLHAQAGGRPVYDPEIASFRPGPGARGEPLIAGAVDGHFDLVECMDDGYLAGCRAAEATGHSPPEGYDAPPVAPVSRAPISPLWLVPPASVSNDKQFVDLQNDVTANDIALAHREGYVSVEHLKRYTTLGMGTDQGKTGIVNALAIAAKGRGVDVADVGTTTYRPPFTPVTIGALAGADIGRQEAPVRRSAMHEWHAAHGAHFVDAGLWKRPNYYLRPGENRDRATVDRAVAREVTAVRNGVGLVDVSTLGKIDIQGPDAAEFLNRLYINGWSKLAISRARYGLMLREDGIVFDDGTTSRLDEDHYLMTTTTGNAGRVMSHLEYYQQVVWPELRVRATSVTEQWAAMALAGPASRQVLQKLVTGLYIDNEAFPFMAVGSCKVAGAPARIFRISFSGELSYEVNVAADYGEAVWQALMAAGEPENIVAYGTEAMAVMRIEKGHVAGPELNGQTTADDLGLGRMQSRSKDYIGLRMVDREAFLETHRPKFVGLTPVDRRTRIEPGSQLVADPTQPKPMKKLGHVTSSAYVSPTLGHPISLGLLSLGREMHGQTVWALSPLHGQQLEVRICDPVFYDPDGGRMRD
jgi:sarcosine oxidase subunit alpha